MEAIAKQETVEDKVIAQLRGYKTIVGRIKVLEKYPIGNGLYLTEPFDEDDKLQPLHRQLKKMPTHMYLTPREQKLEQKVNEYLAIHPVGVKSQYHTIKNISAISDEDQQLIKELARKIRKVVDARGGTPDAFEEALERVAELQDLQDEKERIDFVLSTLSEYKPHYSKLLRLRYIEDTPRDIVCEQINAGSTVYKKWRNEAIKEYARLIGIA